MKQRCFWAGLIVSMGLVGCVNLQAVRDFGLSASEMATYRDAATAYVDSAVASSAYALDGASQNSEVSQERLRQTHLALTLQSALVDYFATLAQLAGEKTFDLGKTLSTLRKSTSPWLEAKTDAASADAVLGLAQTVSKYALLGAQQHAVKGLVQESDAPVVRILQRLRAIASDWKAQVDNDALQVNNLLDVALNAPDVVPLLRVLAFDRKQVLQQEYAVRLKKIQAVNAAFARIEAAHSRMVDRLDDLGGDLLRTELLMVVADLRSLALQLAALR